MGMERTIPGISAGLITLRLPYSTSIPLHKGHAGACPFSFFRRDAGARKMKGGDLMAVVKTPQNSRIGIVIANGVSSTGAEQVKTLRFSNVKPTATDQDMYDVAVSLSGLMASALVEIVRTDEANLTSE